MKNNQKFLVMIVSAILLSLFTLPVYAQSQKIVKAEVDRNEITSDEYLILSVTINTNSGSAPEPLLPSLDGFDVVGTSTSTQMSIVNGAMSSEKVFLYTLRPRAAGEFIIDPVTVSQNGIHYETAPIKVSVSQGTGQMKSPPSAGSGSQGIPSVPGFPNLPNIPGFPSLSGLLQNFGFDIPMDLQESVELLDPAKIPPELHEFDYLVEAEIDNTSPYLGEQVTYTFRYFRPAASSGRSSYSPPDFSGLWVHPDPSESNFAGQIGNRDIRMTEIKTILTPTVLGEVEIAPAEISNEGDVFTRSFSIQTEPKTINVQPLPQDAPASFTGAVGNFTIAAETDLQETKVNDAVTLTIKIDGEGNLDTFADPQWDVGSHWRAFDSQAETITDSQSGVITGTRTIRQVLVPTMWGEFTFPSIQFSYFDPGTETYQTIKTEPITVFVEQSENMSAPVAIGESMPQGTDNLQLHPIKIAPVAGQNPTLFTDKIGYWFLWLVPLGFILAQYAWQSRKKQMLINPHVQRSNKAAKNAFSSLKKLDPEAENFFNANGRILITYLSDKVNRSVSGMTQVELSGLLVTQGVSEELVDRVRSCMTISDMGQYAPIQQVNTDEMRLEVKKLISDLDKVL